ncbi:MAG: CDP-alcohol phosphatidyltransferase family protein [Magnetococcales bacterium]|nr:CDP-alcohol phosphatidyltransferase family protein [Magnetococcales bacterium]MBF0323244.1 CDP-alcohol phosphatidyltransferase family protein [Magnetococcales bacterium]
MNLPNALSFLRIFAVPVFVWLVLNGHGKVAAWLFAMAGATDAVDGLIAKRFDMVTELGGYLDPLADKLLLVSAFITLTYLGQMPLMLTLTVVTRDVIILVGAVVFQLMTGTLRMQPLWISKVNTVVQILMVLLVLFSGVYGVLAWLVEPFVWLTTATTSISGLVYVLAWTRKLVHVENPELLP